jgi:hypothetical protein
MRPIATLLATATSRRTPAKGMGILNSAFRVVVVAGMIASVVEMAAPVASAETNSKVYASPVAAKTVSVMAAHPAQIPAAKTTKLLCLNIKNSSGWVTQKLVVDNYCTRSVRVSISKAGRDIGWHTIQPLCSMSVKWPNAAKYYGTKSIYLGKHYYNPR